MRQRYSSLLERARHGTVFEGFQYRLERVGISLTPYYWVLEGAWDVVLPELREDRASCWTGFFGAYEMKTLAGEGWNYSEMQLLSMLERGKKCFGAKIKGEVAASMWIDLQEACCAWYRFPLNGDEAYLFDMYTIKSFRGKGMAPYVRYQCYKALREMGRNKFYSYSDAFNRPSLRFKKKLGAEFLQLGLYVKILDRFGYNWVIRRYRDCDLISRNMS